MKFPPAVLHILSIDMEEQIPGQEPGALRQGVRLHLARCQGSGSRGQGSCYRCQGSGVFLYMSGVRGLVMSGDQRSSDIFIINTPLGVKIVRVLDKNIDIDTS